MYPSPEKTSWKRCIMRFDKDNEGKEMWVSWRERRVLRRSFRISTMRIAVEA